jgi:predicted TIM-barrel fold metal-dependent hydrolase
MAEVARRWPIAAWKVYTQWGPDGEGWRLDDPEVGIPFIEQARALGIRTICIHKGLKFAGFPPGPAACHDVGPAARRYPDVSFLIYHSGFDLDHNEGPYNPTDAEAGIDALVKSLIDNDVAPSSNVYAELGSTWRLLMRDPDAAAHVLGKLLTHVGRDNVLWGTDSIWYGSPQDQIQAFRSFEIDPALGARHGYPALDPALRQKVFGLNGARVYGIDPKPFLERAARDAVGRRRAAKASDPTFETYGPRTLAEWRALAGTRGGLPA